MKRHFILVALGAAALLLSCSRDGREVSPQPAAGPTAATGQFRLSGPYTHENLTVFLVHGPDRLAGKTYLTLQEALQGKQAIVHETGNVNELTIENLTVDADVFILAGDIVCGGKQDRVISIDLILPPKSGKVKIGVFCVEAGRWTRRGNEAVGYFILSDSQIAGNDMKLAAQYRGDQSGVWSSVGAYQGRLADSLHEDVTPSESETSFALTLQSPAVKASAKAYADALGKVAEGKADVVGAVFVVNGKIRSADIYGCKALFLKLWPKNLNASAVDALASVQKDGKFELPTADHVQAFLVSAEDGQATEKEVSPRVHSVTYDAQAAVQFRTFDRERSTGWVHESCIAKDAGTEPAPPPR
jgi:hypothetical protein